MLSDNIKKLSEYLALEDNWDGEMAEKANPNSVAYALLFLLMYEKSKGKLDFDVSLLCDGKVCVDADPDNGYVGADIMPDGKAAWFIRRNEEKHKGIETVEDFVKRIEEVEF